jgi:hypothetical protein
MLRIVEDECRITPTAYPTVNLRPPRFQPSQKDSNMIIWQGLGILVIVRLLAAILIASSLFNLPGMLEYKAQYKDAVTLFLAALLTLLFGLLLRLKKGKVLIDEDTGEAVEIRKPHTQGALRNGGKTFPDEVLPLAVPSHAWAQGWPDFG